MSYVWEQIYNATGLAPNADNDSDGVSNLKESLAGTDPLSGTSYASITNVGHVGAYLTVTISAGQGKQYTLQSTTTPGSNWLAEASIYSTNGTPITFSSAMGALGSPFKYYRVAITDVDSDGDGINDWEEYKLGLDPYSALSSGKVDLNGQPMSDYAYAVNTFASQNVVTISAPDPLSYPPDPGQTAQNPAILTVTRAGFPLNSITVNVQAGGPGPGFATSGVDHLPLPVTVTLPAGTVSQNVTITPLANTNRLAPVIAMLKLLPGSRYTVGSASNASVVIYPWATPTGTGLTAQYFTNSSATYSSTTNFNPANLKLTRVDPVIDTNWSSSTTLPIANSGYYCVRWTGQVQPQYTETYYFVANTDDGVKLWVNDQLIIDNWVTRSSAADVTGKINLQGGVRYNIKMEMFKAGGNGVAHLSWYSPDQSKQVIPTSRLYPTNVVPAPTTIVSDMSTVAFLGQPFAFAVVGANSATTYNATGVPPGLQFNSTNVVPPGVTFPSSNGVLSGIPTQAGTFQMNITASNSAGLGASTLIVQVYDTSNSKVIREIWNGAGVNISDIPVNTPAAVTNILPTLVGTTNMGDNYGERVRGYFTAPVTGGYRFWISGSDSAELWIANDDQPANRVRRAWVLPTNNPAGNPVLGTASQDWFEQGSQRSAWLSMVAGRKYYIEVLHKSGVASNDGWAVGWLQDTNGTGASPSAGIPGYVLTPYYPLPPTYQPGTLYAATMLADPGVTNRPVGSATMRLSADGSQAVINFAFQGESSAIIGEHINNDPYLASPTVVMYDISAAKPRADGSYLWKNVGAGVLSASDVAEVIRQGKSFITILTANYPNGEMSGHFVPVEGSPSFSPPPAPPAWTDDSSNSNAASRFLLQATYGPSPTEISNVMAMGYAGWISNQFGIPASHHLPIVYTNANPDPTGPYNGNMTFNAWWQQSVTGPDQLRQRVAFALSEIMVVSDSGTLQDNALALSSYYDALLDNAFGNFRTLLKSVTLTPAMGLYLDMRANDAGSMITGLHANENYAREIMQLFSVGLNRMWPDGTLVTDAAGNLVPTYDQNVIMGFASVFTGWNYNQALLGNGRLPTKFNPAADYVNPMMLVPSHHETTTKLLLDNVVLPMPFGTQADTNNVDYDTYCSQDLEQAMDSIFNNQNVGPFICRQLIQRLVTSTPTRDYVYRVTQAFNDNGYGVRGDMQAVVKAILLDYQARSPNAAALTTFGKQREPVLRVTAPARAFPAPPSLTGTYVESGNATISITTPTPHHMLNNDDVTLVFTDTSGQIAPPTQVYNITNTGLTSITATAPGLGQGTYSQVNGTNTFTSAAHGLLAGFSVYISFATGGAASGVYQVATVPDTSHFTVLTGDLTAQSGSFVFSRLVGGGYIITQKTNVTVTTAQAHGMGPGDSAYLYFSSGSPTSGVYQVTAVPATNSFTLILAATNNANSTQDGLTIYPFDPPPVTRSGTVSIQWSTFQMNATDGGGNPSLAQTPLNSPTVFNFFYPDYAFPGSLTAAGLTTPEFQLTSDTTVAYQMNYLQGGILSGSNTNGLTSFNSGNGALVLDISPYITSNQTAATGIPGLVDRLNTLLLAGQLNARARTNIISYVTNTSNFTFSSPPTPTQMGNRVRAVVHLLINSPDFTIQK